MRNKRFFLIAALAVTTVFLFGTVFTAEAGSKNVRDLVGTHAKWAQQLKSDKNFAKKRIVLIVEGQQRSATIDGFLTTVDKTLSDAQHSIFVIPLVVAEHQSANYASVDVNGTAIRKLSLSAYAPSNLQGVVGLVLQYEGDTTLPKQVLANLKTE